MDNKTEITTVKDIAEIYVLLATISESVMILTKYLKKKDQHFDYMIQQIHKEKEHAKH